jgi:Icc-related predicted phosphoesterase
MKRLAIYSDLHLEFGLLTKPEGKADVVVLAGDIYTKARVWKDGNAADFFGCPVVAVLGNHDLYGSHCDVGPEKAGIQAEAKGITLLENAEAVITGIRFLGCTLWSDFRLFSGDDSEQLRMDAAACVGDRYSGGMNDFNLIRVAEDGFRKFRPLDASRIHSASVAWLDAKLSEPFDGPTVVITHHAPSIRCLPDDWRNDRLSCAYASNLDWLIEKHQPALWTWGHIHESVPDFQIGHTKMISNPRGYHPDHLNPNFRPEFEMAI